MHKVSVIIPTYNCAQHITEAVDSVLNQTYKGIQIIVVDDGSTDNTKQVLAPYIEKRLISYLHQENSGPGAARNTGIRAANGEYIAFLDTDDLWYPEKIERQIAILQATCSIGLVFSNMKVSRNGTLLEETWMERMKSYDLLVKNQRCIHRPWKLLLEENFIPTCAVLLKRACIKDVGFFDESLVIGEDWDLWLKIAFLYDFAFIPNPLGLITRDKDVMTYDWEKYFFFELLVLKKFKNTYIEEIESNRINLNPRFASLYFSLGYYQFSRHNYYEKARFNFKKSLWYSFRIKTLLYYLVTYLRPRHVMILREARKRFKNSLMFS